MVSVASRLVKRKALKDLTITETVHRRDNRATITCSSSNTGKGKKVARFSLIPGPPPATDAPITHLLSDRLRKMLGDNVDLAARVLEAFFSGRRVCGNIALFLGPAFLRVMRTASHGFAVSNSVQTTRNHVTLSHLHF